MILIPDLPSIMKSTTSGAERRVAQLLSGVEDDSQAVAFHSVKLRSHEYKNQAEIDFVVLWRGVVIVVEVKGGGVGKHDGKWYSVDRRGDWHKLPTSPMEQSRSAMYALEAIFRESNAGWFAHEAMVITPDIDAPPDSVEWKSHLWLARDSMTVAGLTTALDVAARQSREAPRGARVSGSSVLRDRLFGEFTRIPVIDAQRGAVIDEQSRATYEQARVLASLSRNQRLLVQGGAGTGKSIALAEAAKLESIGGNKVLVTFKSPALNKFFDPLLIGRDISIVPFDELREDERYDVVLMDEAQDLMTAEAMDKLDNVLIGGRAAGRWRFFLDPNNQAHVGGRFDSEVLELVASEAMTLDLSLNVRNTKAIVHVVQEYLGADVGDPGIVHGEKVQWHEAPNDDSKSAALSIATEMLDQGVRSDDVWIIDATSADIPAYTTEGFLFTSPRFAKGLEAEHVIVFGLPADYDDLGTASFYVAVTRARVSLHIVVKEGDRRRLQSLTRKMGRLK